MPKFKFNQPLEKDVEDAILTFLNFQIGVFAFKVQTKASYDPALKRFRRLPKWVMAGTPDIIACFSVHGLPIFVGLEVKTDRNDQTKDQIEFQEKIQNRANGFYFVIRSSTEAEQALKIVRQKVYETIKALSNSAISS